MIIVTIVRHGESTDNLKALWAGSSDAPLSTHGMNQAAALGKSLESYHIDAIFASNLLRATWTAQQIHKQQKTDPKPPLTLSPLLQEQHFGKAERQPWTGTEGGSGYYRQPGRTFKFPDGESLGDVRDRAEQAIAQFIEPIMLKARGTTRDNCPNVFVVAHGIFNAELLGAFLARRAPEEEPPHWKGGGMTNTGWTRIEVGYEDEHEPVETSKEAAIASPSSGPESNPSSTEPGAPDLKRSERKPYLRVRILCTNVSTHLEGVKRQAGGIGSAAYDRSQKGIREFFGGGGTST